jgi:hypothetical protein
MDRSLVLHEVEAARISRQSANKRGKGVSPKHRRHVQSQQISLVLISARGCLNPMAIVRPEGLGQWKIPMSPSGIEPTTFLLVAQGLNQLRQRLACNCCLLCQAGAIVVVRITMHTGWIFKFQHPKKVIYSGTSVHERPCSRTIRFTNKFFEQKTSRMTNGVSDYEHASWQQRQAESIGAGVSVAG